MTIAIIVGSDSYCRYLKNQIGRDKDSCHDTRVYRFGNRMEGLRYTTLIITDEYRRQVAIASRDRAAEMIDWLEYVTTRGAPGSVIVSL